MRARRQRVFYGWWVVLATSVGMLLGYGPIIAFTFGVFMTPLSQEFEWSRSEISLAYSISTLTFSVTQPLYGRLVDRVGSRRVIIPSVFVFGFCLISFSALTARLWHYYTIYAVIGVVAGGTTSLAYFSVVSRWFDRRRGLAMGLAMAGAGVGGLVMPSLVHLLISSVGWRRAYVFIGLAVIVLVVPVVGLLLKESPQAMGLPPDGSGGTPGEASRAAGREAQGLSGHEALRTGTFWLLAASMFLMSASVLGCLAHLVPMLIDRGLPAHEAALAASVLGGAMLLGRVGTGYLLDRFPAPYVTASLFGGAVIAILLLWLGIGGAWVFGPAFLLGLAFSADGVMPYLIGRYFGLRAFGEIYGYAVAMNVFGWVVGPFVMGVTFDATGSYNNILVVMLLAVSTSVGLMLRVAVTHPGKQAQENAGLEPFAHHSGVRPHQEEA